jgi:site-specific DNA recombinase
MPAIGYVRVSTDKQADHGVSLEAQEAKIRAMAVVQGADIVELIVDVGESAKNLNRSGMERLLALVDQSKIQIVITAKLDRLTREGSGRIARTISETWRVAGAGGGVAGYRISGWAAGD